MDSYLELVFRLLDIHFTKEYADLGLFIIEHPQKKIIACHPYGFIFSAFSDLVLGKITEEQFVALGDTTSSYSLQNCSNSSLPSLFVQSLMYGLESSPDMISQIIYIVPKILSKEYFSLSEKLSAFDSQIFFI